MSEQPKFSARQYFEGARAAMRMIDARKAMLQRLKDGELPRAASYDPMPKGKGGVSDPMRATDERMDAEGDLLREIEALEDEVAEARLLCKRVRVIDPTCYGGGLIDLHYFGFLSWKEAGAYLGISETLARQEANRAFKLIEDLGVQRVLSGWAQGQLPI